ncbi:two-component system, sensor histidine kinase YesM [Gracilibacillus ureilyticus]|uniref:Two-component system, sensor histidine kinase YesM n=1 Tax=Gracilibacillus ureilyticus TaxID=531814 RepID=A0A1H9NEG2_9BACI|nr:histidine kinase [Gracilibacillus ureilyticus]SER34241.1 two-component system, sensor histidine kinase YesM [Gracilibacillus ureilyticus]
MFRHWSLRKKFIFVFFVLITLPTILFGSLIYYQATDVFKDQAIENINARLEKNNENLLENLRTIENISSFMIYDESFRTFFTTPEEDVIVAREAENDIKGFFTFQIMSNEYIDSIKLINENGDVLNFGNPVRGSELSLRREAVANEGEPVWSNTYELYSDWSGSHHVISLTRIINDINHISEPIGMARIRLDEEQLYNRIEVDARQQGNFFVLAKNGEVVLHPNREFAGELYPEQDVIDLVVHHNKKNSVYETDGEKFLIVKQSIPGTNWISVIMVNQDDVVQSLYNIRSLIVYMVIILAILGVIAFIGFYLWHIKPILALTEQTKQLEKGNFSAKVNVNSKDEIGRLGTRFNQMVVTIQKYIDREYKLKIKQKESELKALQSQIDPHFLYNTLDMIRWTARMENAMETSKLIERLSKMFRMNLNKGRMWVTLREELLYIENYLELQRSRMGERLKYCIYYDEQIKDTKIMKQLLQPVVENSILHGFKDLSGTGEIYIRCYLFGKNILIDVIDNGAGFAASDTDQIRDGFALENIQERLNLATGEDSEVKQKSVEKGAWVQIKIPLYDIMEGNKKESGENK